MVPGVVASPPKTPKPTTCDAQSLVVALKVLQLVTKEEDRPATLALISSLRKRLVNLPGNLAADEAWRVRLHGLNSTALSRLLLLCHLRDARYSMRATVTPVRAACTLKGGFCQLRLLFQTWECSQCWHQKLRQAASGLMSGQRGGGVPGQVGRLWS